MTLSKLIKTGKLTALISFLIGSFLFLLFYLSLADYFLFIGFGYILIAALVNAIILFLLSVRAYNDKGNRSRIIRAGGLMLLNIPVVLLYCWIAIILTGFVRITFVNTSQTEMSDINITGCEPYHIDKLAPGQGKTVWINVSKRCGIVVTYLVNGNKKTETVIRYCANSGLMNYELGKTEATNDKATTKKAIVLGDSALINIKNKILDTISKLPEVINRSNYIDSLTNHKQGISLTIEKPDSGQSDYQVRAGYIGEIRFETYYNFYVNPVTLEIKIDDVVNGEIVALSKWRKTHGIQR
jgi:hypothetical protein